MGTDKEHTSAAENNEVATVFSPAPPEGEMEALTVKGLLDANGIPAVVVGPHILPNLAFQVQVPAEFAEQARQIIRDARQGGRKAADQAEAESELRAE